MMPWLLAGSVGKRPASASLRVYATWDPAEKATSGQITLTNGNLRATRSIGSGTDNAYQSVRANMLVPNVPVYFEYRNVNMGPSDQFCVAGVSNIQPSTLGGLPRSINPDTPSLSALIYNMTFLTTFNNNGTSVDQTAYGNRPAIGEVLGWAIDRAAGKAWIRTTSGSGWVGGGNPASGTTPTFTFTPGFSFYPALSLYVQGHSFDANFGATAFDLTVPSGFQAGIYT